MSAGQLIGYLSIYPAYKVLVKVAVGVLPGARDRLTISHLLPFTGHVDCDERYVHFSI